MPVVSSMPALDSPGRWDSAPLSAGGGESRVGRAQFRSVAGQQDLHYFLYVPSGGSRGAPLLVSVHGISRNAREHVEVFAPWAERHRVVLLAPVLGRQMFPDYQRLGRLGRGRRADQALQQMVADARRVTAVSGERLHLFGYSGGGQFVHRYALAYPAQVAAYAAGAAGWYTLPDSRRGFPRGTQSSPDLPDLQFDLPAFLSIPGCVLVGERDVERDPELNTSASIDRRQGLTRVERGQRWVAAMERAARKQGVVGRFRFELLPGAGHSFTESVERGRLAERVFAWLFDSAPG